MYLGEKLVYVVKNVLLVLRILTKLRGLSP
jgi:hypothetical protein